MSLDMKIGDYFGIKGTSGDVGIEIEVEGRRFPNPASGYWTAHADGSLRGEDNREYVLHHPIRIVEVPKALSDLFDLFKASKTVIDDSPRTSVHVHLNAQKLYVQEVYTLVACHMIVENLMMHYAGGDRIGNLFCLRTCDAEYLPFRLIEGLQNKTYFQGVTNDNVRYASLNLAALSKFGSLEHRGLRGTTEQEVIQEWVEAVHSLKLAAYKYNDALSLYQDYKKIGVDAFLVKIFGEAFAQKLRAPSNYHKLVGTGSHYAFQVAHATEWMNLENVRKKKGVSKEADMETTPRDEGIPPNINHARFTRLEVHIGRDIPPAERQGVIDWEHTADGGRVNVAMDRLNAIYEIVRANLNNRRQAPGANIEPRPGRIARLRGLDNPAAELNILRPQVVQPWPDPPVMPARWEDALNFNQAAGLIVRDDEEIV